MVESSPAVCQLVLLASNQEIMADTNDFDAAKAICDQLQGMDKDRQQRILRWVAESLDLVLHVRSSPHDASAGSKPVEVALHAPTAGAPGRPADIKTFVDSKKPKSDVQFATVVAYYYRFEAPPAARRETLDSSALQEAARLAARQRFKQPRKTLNNAKNLGYLDAASKGEYAINSVGENLVAMTLPGNDLPSNGNGERRAPARKRRAKAQRSKKQ